MYCTVKSIEDGYRICDIKEQHGFHHFSFQETYYADNINTVFSLFIIYVRFCQLWANWTFQREGSGYRGTRTMPYFFELAIGSFTCPVYSTDTWELGLKSHLNDKVRRGIELESLGFSLERYP